jgi:hypothetical protein
MEQDKQRGEGVCNYLSGQGIPESLLWAIDPEEYEKTRKRERRR